MKNLRYITNRRISSIVLLLMLLGLFSTSCEDQLEENPPSLISLESLNEETVESVIIGMYEPLTRARSRTFESRYLRLLELQAEYQWGRGGNRERISNYNFQEAANDKRSMWAAFYESVNRANTLIDLVGKSDLSVEDKNAAIAEAKFVRAMVYYQLVRIWGEIPLRVERVVDKDQAALGLSSIDNVYSQIIADLQDAEDILPLPEDASPGRATSGAAKAFLADVHLTRGNYADARDKAKEVIDNKATYGYKLVADFASLWSPTDATNSEDVFSIKFAQIIGYGVFHTDAWAPREPRIDGVNIGVAAGISTASAFESGNANPTSPLIVGWDDNDIRKQHTLIDSLEVNGVWYDVIPQVTRSIDPDGDGTPSDERGLYTFGKFRDHGAPGEFGAGNDFYLMRYADVLLIFAEAENQMMNGPTADAYAAINEVITRAYSGNTSNNVSGLSQAEFDDEVFKQRGYEFMQEAKRWFDIVRTDRYNLITEALKPLGDAASSPYWPIPDTETSTNDALRDE